MTSKPIVIKETEYKFQIGRHTLFQLLSQMAPFAFVVITMKESSQIKTHTHCFEWKIYLQEGFETCQQDEDSGK